MILQPSAASSVVELPVPQRYASPGAMPAPEFIMFLFAAPGFAYAVKAVVGHSSSELLFEGFPADLALHS